MSIGICLVFLVGICLSIFWIVLWVKYGRAYDSYIQPLDGSEYFMKTFFFAGFGVMQMFHVNLEGRRFRERVKVMAELKGKQYAQFYTMVNCAAQISYVVTIVPLGALLAVIVNELALFIFAVMIAAILAVYVDMDFDTKLQKRKDEILQAFPHVLSKMALLINAGMPLREVIQVLAQKDTGALYDELRLTVDEMNNGVSDQDAMYNLAERCSVQEVKKLAGTVVQNIKKGSSELAVTLMQMSNEVWQERVGHAKEIGEKASTKLMLPMMIIFVGILLMVLAPMLSGMSGAL